MELNSAHGQSASYLLIFLVGGTPRIIEGREPRPRPSKASSRPTQTLMRPR